MVVLPDSTPPRPIVTTISAGVGGDLGTWAVQRPGTRAQTEAAMSDSVGQGAPVSAGTQEVRDDSREGDTEAAERRRLRRTVQREQARRQAAENLGERATRDLYDSVRQLRSAQADLIENADRTRVISELARALRQDHDS